MQGSNTESGEYNMSAKWLAERQVKANQVTVKEQMIAINKLTEAHINDRTKAKQHAIVINENDFVGKFSKELVQALENEGYRVQTDDDHRGNTMMISWAKYMPDFNGTPTS